MGTRSSHFNEFGARDSFLIHRLFDTPGDNQHDLPTPGAEDIGLTHGGRIYLQSPDIAIVATALQFAMPRFPEGDLFTPGLIHAPDDAQRVEDEVPLCLTFDSCWDELGFILDAQPLPQGDKALIEYDNSSPD